jgi:hypothetical protein
MDANNKTNIRNEIRARDELLDRNGIITFKYSVKKTRNMGTDNVREVEVNLEQLTVSFPNSKGIKDTHDVAVVVSVSPTDVAGKYRDNIRYNL